jgi:hypothetical protein
LNPNRLIIILMPLEIVSFVPSFQTILNAFGLLQLTGNIVTTITNGISISQTTTSSTEILAYIALFHSIIQMAHFSFHSVASCNIKQTEHKIMTSHFVVWAIHSVPIIYGFASSALQQSPQLVTLGYVWTWLHLSLFTIYAIGRLFSSSSASNISSIV